MEYDEFGNPINSAAQDDSASGGNTGGAGGAVNTGAGKNDKSMSAGGGGQTPDTTPTVSQESASGTTPGITNLKVNGTGITEGESGGVIGDIDYDASNSNLADPSWFQELDAGRDGTAEEPPTESSAGATEIGEGYDTTADFEQAQKEAERKLNEFVKEQLDANPFLALVEWDVNTTVVFQPIEDYSGVPTDERNNLAQLEWEEYSSLAGVPTEYRDDVMIRDQELAEQENKIEHYDEMSTEEQLAFAQEQLDVGIYELLDDTVTFDLGEDATQEEIDQEIARRYGNSFDEEPWQDVESDDEKSGSVDDQSTYEPDIELYSQNDSEWEGEDFWEGTMATDGCNPTVLANDFILHGFAWMEIKPDYVASKMQEFINLDSENNSPRDYIEGSITADDIADDNDGVLSLEGAQLFVDFPIITGGAYFEGEKKAYKRYLEGIATGKTGIIQYNGANSPNPIYSTKTHYMNVSGVDQFDIQNRENYSKVDLQIWDVNGEIDSPSDKAGYKGQAFYSSKNDFWPGNPGEVNLNFYMFDYINDEEGTTTDDLIEKWDDKNYKSMFD